MNLIETIQTHLAKAVTKALGQAVAPEDITTPPNADLGDFAVPLFKYAKLTGKNPAILAHEVVEAIKPDSVITAVTAAGPYVNIRLNYDQLGPKVLDEIEKAGRGYGAHALGKKKKVVVEYASPNVNKPFHVGHLRNIITGEAVARLLESAGYSVVRVNYTSDIGMNVAKSVWGVMQQPKELEKHKAATPSKQARFLGKIYAYASGKFKDDETAQTEIKAVNRGIYQKDKDILRFYTLTKRWSLKYFDYLYRRLHARFDHDYFESQMAEPGVASVQTGMKKNVFVSSEGAVIFKGSEHGLHDRVFINSEGLPTYEAKDIALAQQKIKDYRPKKMLNVVGKEQTEYFKVVITALEQLLPQAEGVLQHIAYGWVSLKGGKMSSRTGNVVLAEDVLDTVKKEITKLTKKAEVKNKEKLAEDITIAAVKYAMLKGDVDKDIAFDMDESVSVSGNSGPYLLYTYARIKSIARKAGRTSRTAKGERVVITDKEQQLLLQLARFPEATRQAAETYNPSLVAKYLFDLAQLYNDYYHTTPVLQAEPVERAFRLQLGKAVADVLARGCSVLGFAVVEKM